MCVRACACGVFGTYGGKKYGTMAILKMKLLSRSQDTLSSSTTNLRAGHIIIGYACTKRFLSGILNASHVTKLL